MIEIKNISLQTIPQEVISGEHTTAQLESLNGTGGSTSQTMDTSQGMPAEKPIDCRSHISVKDIQPNQKFFGTFRTNTKDPETGKSVKQQMKGIFKMINNAAGKVIVEDEKGNQYKTSRKSIQLLNYEIQAAQIARELAQKEAERKAKEELQKRIEEQKKKDEELKAKQFNFSTLEPAEKLMRTVEAGIRNIWLVGPAGSGKSTMVRNLATTLNLPYLCISCGIGTSATEFVGYKYPQREPTKFGEYYSKPSVILIDEFTALDPAVAQVCNAALANDEVETTTGLVHRHPECIIVATSNTFGNGADRQYVANNQLDASTIDRFVGGIIEVDYSAKFEAQYDIEVVDYVNQLRNIIKQYDIRRIASTRMIQAGHNLKHQYFADWKDRLIINWTNSERHIVNDNIQPFSLNNQANVSSLDSKFSKLNYTIKAAA